MNAIAATPSNFSDPACSWSEFQRRWGGAHNFLVEGELALFDYAVPPLERIIEETRHSENAIFRSGVKGDAFDLTDIKEEFLQLPLEDALTSRFVLAHFRLHPHLSGPGQVFEGIDELWAEPWRRQLLDHGFTFDNVFPILFASGPHSASNYHMDFTHQLAWQCYGTKKFHGLKEPDRWTTLEERAKFKLEGAVKPAGIRPEHEYAIEQPPGTVLWNAVLTPHWVETFGECAATLTLVHSGLRFNGELCRRVQEWEEWRAVHSP